MKPLRKLAVGARNEVVDFFRGTKDEVQHRLLVVSVLTSMMIGFAGMLIGALGLVVAFQSYREMAKQTGTIALSNKQNAYYNMFNSEGNRDNAVQAAKSAHESLRQTELAQRALDESRQANQATRSYYDNTLTQAVRHFQLQRGYEFAERLGAQIGQPRDVTDLYLASGVTPTALLDAAVDPFPGRSTASLNPQERLARAVADEAREKARNVREMLNFFQQLGVALKRESIPPDYTWDVFGGLAKRYRASLGHHIDELRRRNDRPTLYQDFDYLVGKMAEFDRSVTTAPNNTPAAQSASATGPPRLR